MKPRPFSRIYLRFTLAGALALLLCSIILSSAILARSSRQYKAVQTAIAEARMNAVLEDMNTRLSFAGDLAAAISLDPVFAKSSWQQGSAQQMEMLLRLKSFATWSWLSDEYALLYAGTDEVFRANGRKSYIDHYALPVLGLEGDALRELLAANYQQVAMAVLPKEQLLLLYPVRMRGYSDMDGYATLLVCFSRSQLAERIRQIGGLADHFSLLFLDTPLLALTDTADAGVLSRSLGDFTLTYDLERALAGEDDRLFSPALLLLFAVAFLLTALILGYANYRPIRALAAKYDRSGAADELLAIDTMLEELIKSGDESRLRTERLVQATHDLVLRELLSQGLDPANQRPPELLGPSLQGPHYAVFCLPDEGDAASFLPLIEQLSGEGLSFLALHVPADACIAVILSMDEPERCEEAASLLLALLSGTGRPLDFYCGETSTRPDAIPRSFAGAKKQMRQSAQKPEVQAPEPHAAPPSSARATQVLDFIHVNFADPDLSLDMVSAACGISVNTVCRLVKQQTGRTFRDLLISLRLEEAKRLLASQTAVVSSVYAQVGYTNLSYFIRSFKEYTGQTPAEYQRSLTHQPEDQRF